MEALIDGKSAGRYTYSIDDGVAKQKRPSEGAMDAVVWNAFLAFDVIGDLVGFSSFASLVHR